MKSLFVNLSDQQKTKIEDYAKERDLRISQLVRRWINGLKMKEAK